MDYFDFCASKQCLQTRVPLDVADNDGDDGNEVIVVVVDNHSDDWI